MNQGQFGRTAQLLATTALASGAFDLPNRSQGFFNPGWYNFTVPDGVTELWISGAAGGSGGYNASTTAAPSICIGGWVYQPTDRRWLVTAAENDSTSPATGTILTLREDEFGDETAISMRYMANQYQSPTPGTWSRSVGGNADGSVVIAPQSSNGTQVWVSTDQAMNFVQRTVFSASRNLGNIIGFAGLTTGQCWMAVSEGTGTTRFAYTLDFGLTWTEYTVSTGVSGDVPSWFGIVNGIFVIGGYNGSTGGSWLQTSTTGLSGSWSGRTLYGTGTSARFDGVYYSTNGRYTILTPGNATNSVWNGTALASLTGVSTATNPQKGDINGNTIIFPLGGSANVLRSTDGGQTFNSVGTGTGNNFAVFTPNGNDGRKQIVYIPAFNQWLVHAGGGSGLSYANSYERYSANDGSSWIATGITNAGSNNAGQITAAAGWITATATSWVAFAPNATSSGIGVRARLPLGQATDLTNAMHFTPTGSMSAMTNGSVTRVTRANGENLIRLIAATGRDGASQFSPTPAPPATGGLGGRGVLTAEANGQEGNTTTPQPRRPFGGVGVLSGADGGGGGGGALPFSALPPEGLQFIIPGASAGAIQGSGAAGAGGTIYAVPGNGATSQPSITNRSAIGYGGGSPNGTSGAAFGGSETCWRYRVPVTPGETLTVKVGNRGQGVSNTSAYEMAAVGSGNRVVSGQGMVNLEWRAAA